MISDQSLLLSTIVLNDYVNMHVCCSVSHTTRQMRKDEEQGKDYSFVTTDVFLKGIETVESMG